MALRVEANAEPIPGYRLIERLGGGGFGEVWKCEAPGGFLKAIKFVYGDLSSAGDSDQRAKQELKALDRVRNVRHPYILSLERYEVIDGQLLVIMELADKNLWDRFKECRAQGFPGIPREELLRYMSETGEALDLMNRDYQLQHLDIKPQNLFLVHNHIKVADFGLVKDLEGSQASVTGGITPVYAAPETFDGKVSRYSDQYSLGIVFQELLTGQRPFNGTNVRQLIMQHISGAPNVSSLPAPDQPHILRALSKVPDQRFPTCSELVDKLRGTQTTAPSPSASSAPVGPSTLVGPASIPPTWQGVPPNSSGPVTANLRIPPTDQSSQGQTQSLRAADPPVLGPHPQTPFRAPAEVAGSGCLFPALVLGLGQVGLSVLQRVRETLHLRVAPATQLPHIRLLLLDTDPEVIRQATRTANSTSLCASEVLLAPLNRPSHYLKPREGRPNLETWLNPRMLYRIPRSQVTSGVRALGRLAFVDNYRSIARRLQSELESLVDPQVLQSAARHSRLGMRCNRPRVYIMTSLGGGTGSGIFLDVAYTIRALLKQMGIDNPDIIGVLMVPPVDSSRTRVMTLGNTHAALLELDHFGSPKTVFQARYHERETAIMDADPPFSRTVLLPLPEESDEVAQEEFVDLVGQFLYRDMATPLGRAADLARAGQMAPAWELRGQHYQTFNLFQLCWPRHLFLQTLSRKLCHRIVQRWASKDSKPFREKVQQLVQDQWLIKELGADVFIHRLQTEVVKLLGKPPESMFSAILEPLLNTSSHSDHGQRARPEPRGLIFENVLDALVKLEGLIGKPGDDTPTDDSPELIRVMREGSAILANVWSQALAEISVRRIEEPEFRLAGAEETVRQLVATLEQVLQHHEPLARDLTEKAAASYERLQTLTRGPKRTLVNPGEILELLRVYPKWRFQSLVLQQLAAVFVGLRGHLSDELREINFCRVRLAELARQFEDTPSDAILATTTSPRSRGEGIGKTYYLSGCKSLGEASNMFLDAVTPQHLLELDSRMEEMLRERFNALVHVCVSTANILPSVANAMLEVGQQFVAEHLPPTSVAELFFDQFSDPQEAEAELVSFHNEAAPELTPSRTARRTSPVVELTMLATPDDPASRQLREKVRAALPETEIQEATIQEDILFYRERLNLLLGDLEQAVGPTARDAYNQMTSTENFTPHNRTDVHFGRS